MFRRFLINIDDKLTRRDILHSFSLHHVTRRVIDNLICIHSGRSFFIIITF